MALTLPKLALPKLALDKKQIPAVVGGVVVVAAAGWFGWQYFGGAEPPPVAKIQPVTAAKPPAAAKAAAPADTGPARDKLIEDTLIASGLKRQLERLPQQLIAGLRQSGKKQSKASAAADKAIEDAVAESFTAQRFHARVSAALNKNFDKQRLQTLLKEFSTPAATRMVERGKLAFSPDELVRFERSPAATAAAPERESLLKRIDTASRASELAIEVAFTAMKAIASAVAAVGPGKSAAMDKAIEKERASSTQDIRSATLRNLKFSLKDASDAELEDHAKFYEAQSSKWFTGIVYASIVEEVKSASAQAGERIGAVASATPAATPVRSKAGLDARICLGLASNEAIIKCAEDYR